jgi:type I restriction enzyme, S subunit
VTAWPTVRLGEVLRHHVEAVPVHTQAEFNMAGVYSFGRGLFARGPLAATETTYRCLHRLRENDFVISQPKAWEGALARVPKPFDGWFLSPVFPTFRALEGTLDIRFLEWFCKQRTVWSQLASRARGMGARRETVAPDAFLETQIPLPPPAEQRRIVAKLDQLSTRVQEATRQRAICTDETRLLITAAVTDADTEFRKRVPVATLTAFASPLKGSFRSGPFGSALLHDAFFAENGVPAVGIQDVQENRFVLTGRWNVTPAKAKELARYTIKPGDVLVTVMGTLGRACWVPDDVPLMISTKHVWTMTLDRTVAEPRWISYWLNFSKIVRKELLDQGTGTAIAGLNGAKIRALTLPVIPLVEQRRMIHYLDRLECELGTAKELAGSIGAELDALMPAMLDRAFKGQL